MYNEFLHGKFHNSATAFLIIAENMTSYWSSAHCYDLFLIKNNPIKELLNVVNIIMCVSKVN